MDISPLSSNMDLIKKGQSSGFDLRKVAKGGVGIGLLCVLGYGFMKALPFLVTAAKNMIYLSLEGIVLFLLFILITNKSFWKRIGYFIDALSKFMLGWLIEFDEFILQEKQIEEFENDSEKADEQRTKVNGKYVELEGKESDNVKQRDIAQQKIRIATQQGDSDAAEDATAEMMACQDYIDTVSPIINDMKIILDFSADMQKKLARNIKNAKMQLQKNKDAYYSAIAGAKALTSLKRAFLGDSDLNRDADMAMERVKQKTALSIGQMRSSMEILSQISKEQNLNDKAKFALARQQMEALSQNTTSDSDIAAPSIPITLSNFSDIKMPVKSSYDDLIK